MADATMEALEQAPLATLVENLGLGIARAQAALDRSAIELAVKLADPELGLELGGQRRSLLSLGFAPTFYQFTEATIDIKVSFSTARSNEFSIGASVGVTAVMFTASVNASYSQKYSYKAEGSSAVTTRLVTVPAPTVFHQLLRSLSNPEPDAQ
ncbi:MAG TPA: hypothetical protein VK034_31795 [Enhygromyxa sp.]|nr:hypothetical protein [Enhygromyxa sp.]